MRFGEFLVAEGRVSHDAVQLALAQQRRRRVPFGVLAVRAGMLDVTGVDRVLKAQETARPWRRFGNVARDLGLMDEGQIGEILRRQHVTQPKVGELLVEQGALQARDLSTLLERHGTSMH